jgi:hypothetical protein
MSYRPPNMHNLPRPSDDLPVVGAIRKLWLNRPTLQHRNWNTGFSMRMEERDISQ